MRNFRLDRIAALDLLPVTFVRPPEFTLHMPNAERSIAVTACFDAAVAPWVRENPSFYATEITDTPDGLLITFHVRRFDELVPWLLSWGGNMEVRAGRTTYAARRGCGRAHAPSHRSLLTYAGHQGLAAVAAQ